jgi:fructose-1,6-bisphosphatase/sedoheptulose 1,7-bisphosphatase-like protein
MNTICKPKKTNNNHNINTRVINLSPTQFNKEQIHTMALGPNYAIIKKPQTYINELIAETEYAIRKLDAKIQNPYRYMAATKIKQITESHTTYQQHKRIQHNINEVKEILHRDDLVVTKADKSKP